MTYAIDLHLDNGSVVLNTDGTVSVEHLRVVWDKLTLSICFDLPRVFCIPSFCIVPDPWNGCLVGFPGYCLIKSICADLDLSGLVSEVSELRAKLNPVYRVDPGRLPGWTDLDAEMNGKPNQWRIFLSPTSVLMHPVNVPATAANLFEAAVKKAIGAIMPGWLPGWAKDYLWSLIGPVVDLIKGIFGIAADIESWLSDLIDSDLKLLPAIETAIVDQFASKYPIYEFEDPYPILPGTSKLIPVKIPIRNLHATVNAYEMVLLADVGA